MSVHRGFILACIIYFVIVAICHAQKVIYVDSGSTDTSVSCGSSIVESCGTIQAALDIADSGDIISLLPGTYSGDGNEGITNLNEDNSADLSTVDLTLTGLGSADEVVIACVQSNRFLTIGGNFITIMRNMTISGCTTPASSGIFADPTAVVGGAFYLVEGDIMLVDMTFENNRAEMGGSIALKYSNVTIDGCHFNYNNATIFGGAIASDASNIMASHTDFTGNVVSGVAAFLRITLDVVGRGGAIFSSEGQYVNLTHCSFTSNRALITGGGVHLQYLVAASIDFSVFSRNSVTGSVDCVSEASCSIRGGALYMDDINSLITDTIFINNSVSTSTLNRFAEGGAVYLTAIINRFAVVRGCQFYENSAFSRGDNNAGGYGGALTASGIQLHVSTCEFELNYVSAGGLFTEYSSNGGALWIAGDKHCVVETSIFFSNRALQGTAGAIFVTDAPDVLVQNCSFSANIAQSSYVHKSEGGAIVVSHKSYMTLIDCVFLRNLAEPVYSTTPLTYSGTGGGIYIQSASANISRCRFSNNHVTTGQFDSGGSGGAISMIDSQLTHISHCRFLLNSARGYAGAYSYSSSGTGGALSIMFSSAIIDHSFFNYNWASAGGTEYSLGGAVSIFYDNTNPGAVPIQISNSEFRGNIATGEICTNTVVYKAGEGGAISVFGSEVLGVDITNVLFQENVADTQSTLKTTSSFGGAIMLSQSSSVRMYSCNFSSNVAHNGYAADISSITDSEESQIHLNLTDCYFKAATTIDGIIERILAKIPSLSCNDGTASDEFASFEAYATADGQQVFSTPRIVAARARHFSERYAGNSVLYNRLEHSELGRHLVTRQSIEYINTRRLSTLDGDSTAVFKVDASIIVGAGLTLFDNPVFDGEYHVFGGNIITAVLEDEYSYFDQARCRMSLVGTIEGKELNVIALKSEIVVGDERNATLGLELSSLVLFNSTLTMNYDINVTGLSIVMGTTIESNHFLSDGMPYDAAIPLPILSYLGPLHSGFFDFAYLGSQYQPFQNIETAIFSPDIIIDNVDVHVFNYYSMASTSITSTLPGKNVSTIVPDLNLHILHYGSLQIFEYATVHLSANLSVYDDSNSSRCGIINRGEIILGKPQVSLKSVIDMKDGCFQQTKSGLLTITLSSATNLKPFVTTKSSSTIQGTVNVTLFRGNSTKLNLYGSNPSNWILFGFQDNEPPPDGGQIEIIAPIGLNFITDIEPIIIEADDVVNSDRPSDMESRQQSFSTHRHFSKSVLSLRGSTSLIGAKEPLPPTSEKAVISQSEKRHLDEVRGYKEGLYLSEMACNQVSSYYVIDPNEGHVNCSVCLQNSSCGFCFSSDTCIMEGSGCSGNFENNDGNCCPEMCNGNGHCNSDLTCDCYFLYTTTSNCKEWSFYFFIIIFGCNFIVFFVLLSLRYYISYRRQKENVLEKLRKRLLSGEGGNDGKEGGFVTNNFLQNLQQDLILRDVFVNNDEIKLEEKIGEGSFGVVFKASFRGAQVAVKQMRSPVFLQLSEHDIEEFRKEAYMMSRWGFTSIYSLRLLC